MGDVHGCATELAALVGRASRVAGAPVSRLVLVGDVFTKGPDPLGTWRVVQAHGAEAVLGNHDARMLAAPRKFASMGLPEAAWRWLEGLPLFLDVGGWTVVHAGLDPEGGRAATRRATALVVRRWPDDTDASHPFWWQGWSRDERVVYGHDAARGLQDHRPHTLGLDTGCVYGGALTGYLVEADRLVRVAAQETYRPVA